MYLYPHIEEDTFPYITLSVYHTSAGIARAAAGKVPTCPGVPSRSSPAKLCTSTAFIPISPGFRQKNREANREF